MLRVVDMMKSSLILLRFLTIVGIAVGWVVVITWLNSLQNATFVFRLIFILAMLFISFFYSLRFVIFEENYFF